MTTDTAFSAILEGASSEIASVAQRLRALILDLRPDIDEGIYGGKKVKMASYSIGQTDNVIAVLSPAPNHCKLYLHHIDQISTEGLDLEGKGKHARHIKIFNHDGMDEALYRFVFEQIAEIAASRV